MQIEKRFIQRSLQFSSSVVFVVSPWFPLIRQVRHRPANRIVSRHLVDGAQPTVPGPWPILPRRAMIERSAEVRTVIGRSRSLLSRTPCPMKLLAKLEQALTPYAVPNLTVGLIMAQGLVFLLAMSRPAILVMALLVPERVLEGQLWRLVTFVAVPPTTNPLFAFFFWYMFYLMGRR